MLTLLLSSFTQGVCSISPTFLKLRHKDRTISWSIWFGCVYASYR